MTIFMRRLSRLWRVAVLALLVGSLAIPASAAAPDGAGTLISQMPLAGAPDGALAWRIRYRSVAQNGAKIEITGVIIVPAGPAPESGRDVVSWGHSTVGIASACAPTTTPNLFKNIAGLPAMLARGWVVTATDFQGLGTPGPHPYLVGIDSGRAMLDAVRAARALPQASAGKRYVLWGESEGGHAALWAAQLAPTYAPELDLIAVAAAAPPTDLIGNFDAISNPAVRALMTGYTSASWSRVYGIPLSTFANGIGRYFIHRLAKDCVRLDPASALTNVGLLLLSHQLPTHLGKPWTKPLRDNSVKPEHLGVPMFIAQGGKDDVVNATITQKFAVASCYAGVSVTYHPVADATHSSIAAQSASAAVAWLADRFADKPPMSGCAKLEETLGTR